MLLMLQFLPRHEGINNQSSRKFTFDFLLTKGSKMDLAKISLKWSKRLLNVLQRREIFWQALTWTSPQGSIARALKMLTISLIWPLISSSLQQEMMVERVSQYSRRICE